MESAPVVLAVVAPQYGGFRGAGDVGASCELGESRRDRSEPSARARLRGGEEISFVHYEVYRPLRRVCPTSGQVSSPVGRWTRQFSVIATTALFLRAPDLPTLRDLLTLVEHSPLPTRSTIAVAVAPTSPITPRSTEWCRPIAHGSRSIWMIGLYGAIPVCWRTLTVVTRPSGSSSVPISRCQYHVASAGGSTGSSTALHRLP